MSTLDLFIEEGKKLGLKEGKKEGIALGIETEKRTFTQTLLAEQKFSVAEIARLVGVSIEFIENVKRDILSQQ